MRRRITSLVVSLALVLVLVPQAHARPEYSVTYYVYYTCICTGCYGVQVGEWTLACDGHWYGWGWRPYENSCATWVDEEIGEDCNPWD